jgi:hypothetical protein
MSINGLGIGRSTALVALLLAASSAHAAPVQRIAVVVGANFGGPDDEPLRFAEADARRMRELLVELGEVRRDRALLVLGGGPAQVLSALTEARGRAAELAGAGQAVSLLFYYSGHGDEDALHLPRGTLALPELRRELARIPARLQLTLLDACRTGGRKKGAHRGPDFALAVAPEAPAGTVELRSSSAGEAAQESEELGGSVFTHFLMSGLRGAADSDGDGQVSVDELYRYVYRRTLRHTGTGSALQHPTLATVLSGAGELVVSRPASAAAALQLPAGADRYLVFALPSGAVMGELSGDTVRTLALPAGRFLVERRAGSRSSVAELDLSGGGVRQLRAEEFRPIAREELWARGGRLELHPFRLDAELGGELAPASPEGPALRVGLGAAWEHGALALSLGAAWISGGYSGAYLTGSEHSLSGQASLAWRRPWRRMTFSASAGVELRYTWEQLFWRDPATPAALGVPPEEARSFGSAGPRAGLRLTVGMGRRLSLVSTLFVAGLFRREQQLDSTQMAFHPVIGLVLGGSFSL